jgi:hypothetical protein
MGAFMSRSFKFLAISSIVLTIAALLMVSHPAYLSFAETEEPTIASTAQGTQIAAIVPTLGHWEGTIKPSNGDSNGLSVSFDLTASQKIEKFKMVLPFKTGTGTNTSCTFTGNDINVEINSNGALVGTHSIDKSKGLISNIWNHFDWQPTIPPVTITREGEMAEITHITGNFTDPTTVSGDYRFWGCADEINAHASEGTWSANLKTPLQVIQEPTVAATTAPTLAATSAATQSAAVVPVSGEWFSGEVDFTTSLGGQAWVLFTVTADGKSVEGGLIGVSLGGFVYFAKLSTLVIVNDSFSTKTTVNNINIELTGTFVSTTKLEGTLTFNGTDHRWTAAPQ